MKHFKHLKPGMSLIEVMMAIAIFAIFGSSLFIMQQYVFDRMMISQTKLVAMLRMQEELAVYQTEILKEFFEQQGSVVKSLEEKVKDFTRPDMIVTIKTKSDFSTAQDQKESSFKDFKNLYLICVQAQDVDDKERFFGRSYMFMYIPDIVKPKD